MLTKQKYDSTTNNNVGFIQKDCKSVLKDYQLNSNSKKEWGVKDMSEAMGVDESTVKELQEECK